MNNNNSKFSPAFVSYMSYSGLGIVRSLGRRGVPVYALDPNANQIGIDSHYCKGLVCPAIEDSEKEHIDFLIELSQSLGQKAVLYPTGDNTVFCYANYESRLQNNFYFTGPDHEIITKVATKDALFKSAVACNVPVPETYIPHSIQEVFQIGAKITYPCLIKPIRSNSWHQKAIKEILSGDQQKVLIANNPDELLGNYEKIVKYDPDVIIVQGVFVKAGDFFMGKLCERIKSVSLMHIDKDVRIVYSHFGPEAGVVGASAYVVSEYFK